MKYHENTRYHSRNVENLKNKKTPAEERMFDLLKLAKFKFKFQKGFFTPCYRIVDFYLPRPYGVIIEVDGKIHEQLKSKDAYKDSSWKEKRNMVTFRVKNEEVFKLTPELLRATIENICNQSVT